MITPESTISTDRSIKNCKLTLEMTAINTVESLKKIFNEVCSKKYSTIKDNTSFTEHCNDLICLIEQKEATNKDSSKPECNNQVQPHEKIAPSKKQKDQETQTEQTPHYGSNNMQDGTEGHHTLLLEHCDKEIQTDSMKEIITDKKQGGRMTWRRRPLLGVALCSVCALATFYLYLGVRGTPVRVQFLANVTRLRGESACVAGDLVIVVLSEPDHREIRQVIRNTWGHPDVLRPLGVGLAFAVAANEASADDPTQRPMHWEAEVFGDTVQAGEEKRALGVVRIVCRPSAVLLLGESFFVNPFALQTLIQEVLSTSSSEEKTLWCLPHTTNGSSEIFPKTAAVLLPARTLHQLLDSGQRTMSVEEMCRLEGSAGALVQRRFSSPLVDGGGVNVSAQSAALVHLGTEVVDRTGQLWRGVLASRGMDLMKSRETF